MVRRQVTETVAPATDADFAALRQLQRDLDGLMAAVRVRWEPLAHRLDRAGCANAASLGDALHAARTAPEGGLYSVSVALAGVLQHHE